MSDVKFNEFVDIVKRLRKECPWDKEQSNDSIKAATLEEAYEVVHAIDDNDFDELKKELGDLLLHVVFHTIIAEESGHFTIDEVINSISEKMIRRHPHIFSDVEVNNSNDVKKNWETIKLAEGRSSVLDGLPSAMPALLRAHRMQEKASKVGFDWNNKKDVWDKVVEEINELQEIEDTVLQDKIEEEFGDILFALTNYSRFLNINPENALRKACNKFEKRFRFIEQKLDDKGSHITKSNLEEMETYWNESKREI
ncbi:MAG: nucleoside triphosphate pyrophosphohydrolase [Ignavibacteria bacterium]|jgi:XTP/dITP diphosphohydrolase|nr:nucleoside triphosphate pyrophosphohydrolase [Ignavibacteria bacterium]